MLTAIFDKEKDFFKIEQQMAMRLQSGGGLSLDDIALVPGDFLNFTYDFGSPSTITIRVDRVDLVDEVLPEIEFDSGMHRARVSVMGTARLTRLKPSRGGQKDDSFKGEE